MPGGSDGASKGRCCNHQWPSKAANIEHAAKQPAKLAEVTPSVEGRREVLEAGEDTLGEVLYKSVVLQPQE